MLVGGFLNFNCEYDIFEEICQKIIEIAKIILIMKF